MIRAALLGTLLLGCASRSFPPPSPDRAQVVVELAAEPKAGLRWIPEGAGTPYPTLPDPAFERVDYRRLPDIAVVLRGPGLDEPGPALRAATLAAGHAGFDHTLVLLAPGGVLRLANRRSAPLTLFAAGAGGEGFDVTVPAGATAEATLAAPGRYEVHCGWAAEHRDPALRVHQVIHAGDAVTGQTLGDAAAASEALRAAAAAAGAGRFEARLAGERHPVRSEPLGGAGVGFQLKSLDRELAPLHRLLRQVGLAGAVALVLGAAAAWGMAWLVIRRLQRLKQATLRVRSGDFETRVGARGRDEVALLGRAFDDMVVGLKALGLYTDPALARHILDRSRLMGEEGLRTEGTVFFCDLEGFTSVAESLPAEELIRQLEEYFTLVGRVVAEEGGYLDKFIGDSVMAWWGPPFLEEPDHAARALRAAWRCRAGAAELRERWAAGGRPLLRQRVGIATGEVIVGNLGSATKKNFTVIGDRVNVASRLEGANKRYGTEILVDGETARCAGPLFRLREIDRIQVPGRQEAVHVFELIGVGEEAEVSR